MRGVGAFISEPGPSCWLARSCSVAFGPDRIWPQMPRPGHSSMKLRRRSEALSFRSASDSTQGLQLRLTVCLVRSSSSNSRSCSGIAQGDRAWDSGRRALLDRKEPVPNKVPVFVKRTILGPPTSLAVILLSMFEISRLPYSRMNIDALSDIINAF